MYHRLSLFFSIFVLFMLLLGCDSITNQAENESLSLVAQKSKQQQPGSELSAQATGAVYTQSNDMSSNEIVAYSRNAKGLLSESGRYATGGQGTGSGLGSQGAVALSSDHQRLFAVNAGSNELSVFGVQPGGLDLLDSVQSGGEQPVSVTVHGNLVYVVHAGGSGNITGFTLSNDGNLTSLSGSTQNLSNDGDGAAPGPAQISFTPNGGHLVVTEKASNLIGVYPILDEGKAGSPAFTASNGQTPFGFSFSKKNVLLVSEAFGGGEGLSATSSYAIGGDGSLELISGSVLSDQSAACWAVTTQNGKYTYISNTQSGTVTGYSVGNNGAIELLDANGITGSTGGQDTIPIDMALSNNSRYLYVLNAGSDDIVSYRVQSDGSLTTLGSIAVPATSVGLTAK